MQQQKKSNWFNENFIATPEENPHGCGKCFFHNCKTYCTKVTCTYLLQNGLKVFQWQPVHKHCVFTWQKLSDFFDSTYIQDIKDISRHGIEQTISKQKRGR